MRSLLKNKFLNWHIYIGSYYKNPLQDKANTLSFTWAIHEIFSSLWFERWVIHITKRMAWKEEDAVILKLIFIAFF